MKAVQFRELGGPEVLEYVDLPDPVAGAGQVLVRVESAAVNFSDVARRRGSLYPVPTPLPFVPGAEVAGEVVALGDGVTEPTVGTRVFGFVDGDGGGYAQYVLLGAGGAVPIPDTLSADAAAGLLIVGLTASLMVEESAHLRSGETIFVPAASGGLANYAIQFAKLRGATVIGGASTPEKRDIAIGYGADHVVDYTASGWTDEVIALTGGRGADVVLEMTSPAHVTEGLSILAPFGRLVVYGAAAGDDSHVDPAAIERLVYDPAPLQSLIGFNVGAWFQHRPQETFAALGRLVERAASGEITVPNVRTFPLVDAAEAHRLIESGRASGKLVLKP